MLLPSGQPKETLPVGGGGRHFRMSATHLHDSSDRDNRREITRCNLSVTSGRLLAPSSAVKTLRRGNWIMNCCCCCCCCRCCCCFTGDWFIASISNRICETLLSTCRSWFQSWWKTAISCRLLLKSPALLPLLPTFHYVSSTSSISMSNQMITPISKFRFRCRDPHSTQKGLLPILQFYNEIAYFISLSQSRGNQVKWMTSVKLVIYILQD